MKLSEIEILIERYYKGETSLSEEKRLKEFFTNEDIPENMLSIKEQFQYFSSKEDIPTQSINFEEKIVSKITSSKKKPIIANQTIRSLTIGIAAGIALFFSINYFIENTDNSTITNGIKTSIHTDTNQTNNSDSTKVR